MSDTITLYFPWEAFQPETRQFMQNRVQLGTPRSKRGDVVIAVDVPVEYVYNSEEFAKELKYNREWNDRYADWSFRCLNCAQGTNRDTEKCVVCQQDELRFAVVELKPEPHPTLTLEGVEYIIKKAASIFTDGQDESTPETFVKDFAESDTKGFPAFEGEEEFSEKGE